MKWGWKIILLSLLSLQALAKPTPVFTIDQVKKDTEIQVRNLIEPVLQKFCRDECRLMTVTVNVDLSTPDEIAPGFDDVDPKSLTALAPSSARIKLLIDEQVGPVSRSKLIDLIQQYLDTLDFPIKIDYQLTHFPQPVSSAAKVAELKEKISKQFNGVLEDLFRLFCPEQCMLAQFNLQTDAVNLEEAQYGAPGEFILENGVAIRIKNISATILMDDILLPEEQKNIFEMAKLKTNHYKNVSLYTKVMKFPHPAQFAEDGQVLVWNGKKRVLANKTQNETKDIKQTEQKFHSTDTKKEQEIKQERFERFEKIERVENGDAVQAELKKFKIYGIIFACSILAFLIFISLATTNAKNGSSSVHKVFQSLTSDPTANTAQSLSKNIFSESKLSQEDKLALLAKRYEIDRLYEELLQVFAEQPKVAKHVFSRILTEEGVETTAGYVHIFGESVVMDMLRDPSLQGDMSELTEYYAKNPIELSGDEKLELLRKLHQRTVSGKLVIMGSRTSHHFDFLAEMDGLQILELVSNESLTVKAIALTQCDHIKRTKIYSQLDENTKMSLLTELSRIDYLPRDYIFNVANALKRKKRENPRLNTESLPGSEVLVNLLERSGLNAQKSVIKNLEANNPDSARTIKNKLVSLDTLRYMRDGQLLEVVLSLKHDELLQFLKGCPTDIKQIIFSKSPKDLVSELEEELTNITLISRENYQNIERKIINRIKVMANDGLVNLLETNERMFGENTNSQDTSQAPQKEGAQVRKVAGW
ncbi:MAG: hypothetical protein HY843_08335 [Bdellovibrio sp.]|nr:hypothetical protein [Bdellovibrio sp.]